GQSHKTFHVALLTRMFASSKNYFQHLSPIPYWLIIHSYNHITNDRRADAFVGERELNWPIAAAELEDRPHRRAHLLALHVSGVTGNTQSQESDKRSDDYVISNGATEFLPLRPADHGIDAQVVGQARLSRR